MTYGSRAGFIEYHEARAREIPATWDNQFIDASLLVASEWIDNIYGSQFSGQKTGGFAQVREWPRLSAYATVPPSPYLFDDDAIPDRVISATYEAAWRQATTPGSLQVDYTPGKYRSVSVDGAVSVDYALFLQASDVQTQIGIIDSLLWPLLNGPNGGMSTLSGGTNRT